MRLTVARKLSIGLGSLLALLVVLSVLVINQLRVVDDRTEAVSQRYVPAVETGLALRSSVHHALSMHRGYMILGLDALADERHATWKRINADMAKLEAFSADWTDPDAIDAFDELKSVFAEFASAQQRIEDVAHTPGDLPANTLYFDTAVPFGDEMMANLDKVLVEERTLEATTERKELVERIGAARGHLLKASAAISAYLVSGDRDALDRVGTCVSECQASVDRLMTMTGLFTETQSEAFDAYIEARTQFLATANEAIGIRGSEGYCASEDICLNQVTPLSQKASDLLDVIVASQMESKDEAIASVGAATASMNSTVTITSIFAVVVGVGVSWFLTTNIRSALTEVSARAEQIASSNLSNAPLDSKRKDEFGDLARLVDRMQDALRNVISQVSGSASEVAAGVTQISATCDQIASGMTSQNTQVQQVSAAVEEMAASISEVAEKTGNARNRAVEAGRSAEDGGQVVQKAIGAMNDIKEAVNASAISVQELGRRGQQIGEIVGVINDIAEQTNLLALNAAIEAARAGEHGRGFAVVADEVRKLADRTTNATEEIVESITAIQNETEQAVGRMNVGTQQVDSGVESVGRTSESLAAIVSDSHSISEMVAAIAAAAEEQSAASTDVSRNIISISEVTAETVEGTRQAATAAMQLTERATQLRSLTDQFRL